MLGEIDRGESLVEIVLQRMTDAIVAGEIGPDEKLVEARLAQQLGVSRGPVREAVRRLEQMGLVEKVPYLGTFVTGMSREDIEELYEVRAPLEALAARILAERENPQDVSRLREIIHDMQKAIEQDRPSQLFFHDAAFHDTLIELTENKLLAEIWKLVSIQMRRIILMKRERPYHSLHDVVAVHQPIVDAIASKDPERAAAEARRHVTVSLNNFWKSYRGDGHGDGSGDGRSQRAESP